MSKIAEETGLAREALYRSLATDGNPTLKSMPTIMHALGLELASKRTGT